MSHDVFISYAHSDKPIADAICNGLENAGIRCWIAPRDIMPGSEYGEAIIDALGSAAVTVLVFSEQANASKQVLREIERSVTRGITIVTVRIADVMPTGSMEYFLGVPHWLDAMSPPLEQHILRLADTVHAIVRTSLANRREATAPVLLRSESIRPAPARDCARSSVYSAKTLACVSGLLDAFLLALPPHPWRLGRKTIVAIAVGVAALIVWMTSSVWRSGSADGGQGSTDKQSAATTEPMWLCV